MKKIIAVVLLFFAAFLMWPGASYAEVINGSFEDDLNGWNVEYGYHAMLSSGGPILDTPFPTYMPPMYTYEAVVTSDPILFTDPADGATALYLDMVQNDTVTFIGPDGEEYILLPDYYLSVTQEVYMQAGEMLSGSLAFATMETPDFSFDRTTVTVNGDELFSLGISDAFDWEQFESLGFSHTSWQPWSWIAPIDGHYALSISLFGDDQISSWMLADNILHTVPVPEPSAVFLLSLGMIILGWLIGKRRGWKTDL